MTNYDFSTLSPLDFEKLACDLLNAKLESRGNKTNRFMCFKSGKDKGIDLLLSTQDNNLEIVGQVKHYVNSSFTQLRHEIKNKEKDKVIKLNPNAYVFVTSLELLPQQKIEIKEIFEPYIKSLEDIFDRNDLNALLRKNTQIEDNHFKLWFSSSLVLNKILNYKYKGRKDEFTENVLIKKIRLYVFTEGFYRAKSVLKNNNFLVLTGDPGVGKTSLSEMLIYDYIKEDFDLTVIYESIKEVEDTLKDDESKQLFYFDDFLGHTQAEIEKSKSVESYLIKIISRIENLKNKILILNTRRFILSAFLDESEKFTQFNPLRVEAKVEISTYSYGAKRRMLDNHLSESKLNQQQKLLINELSDDICRHKNFSPRIVEFFTSTKVCDLNVRDLKSFILTNLENPKEIWRHAYVNQIDDYNRFFINTLFSLQGNSSIEKFKIAYEKRLKYEVLSLNCKLPMDSFNQNLRRLNEGFVYVSPYHKNMVEFINSSLEDYLKYLILNNQTEIERILLSSCYLDQWFYFFKPFEKQNDVVFSKELKNYFQNNFLEFIDDNNKNRDIYLALIFGSYYLNESFEKLSGQILESIDDWGFLLDSYIDFYSKNFLKEIKRNNTICALISKCDNDFFLNSFLEENYLLGFFDIVNLFKNHFDLKIKRFLNDLKASKNYSVLFDHFEGLFDDYIKEMDNELMAMTDIDDYDSFIYDLEMSVEFVRVNLFKDFVFDLNYIKKRDWEEIILNNTIEIEKNKDFINSEQYYLENDFDSYYYYNDEYDDYYANDGIVNTIIYDDNEPEDLPF